MTRMVGASAGACQGLTAGASSYWHASAQHMGISHAQWIRE
eukprot:CAMPEP_0181179532 /NCGR_PEP_ID=MMETSP1096-20121128/6312_1 /TAXON_ID=156174 ORGANISM="Chrysochromulina ericina, Strain CCMP281" /NCGR_SAMPLE_ID=MMETSP1096 /ASSEMBLY_ACC=CAM_ASM_000453 /LENGTH=40 /DNA_ID= /DNA_START= /DNA_END= /DNA_ORIENTATION=